MKLALIIDHLSSDLAGTEGQVVKLIRGLGPAHEIDLIVLRDSEWLQSAKAALPCAVEVIGLAGVTQRGFLPGLWRLVRFLRRRRPDVAHTFFPIANIVGVLGARLAGVRAVIASRRDYGHWITPGYLRATRFANRFLDGIVTNAPQVREFTERVEGVPRERIEVIYNGVDVEALRRPAPASALKAKLGIPAHHKVITLVANYRPIKRHDTLLDAMGLLRDSHPDVSLLFIGADNVGEPALQAVLAHARKLGLTDRIYRAQAKGDIADYLSICDIGVNCSESEGLSNAIIEYLAAGVPCVASDGGGNRDLIQDGVDGLSFPVGDHQALARQLARLLDDEALRTSCAQAGLKKVRAEMALDVIIARFAKYYLDAAKLAA